LDKMITHLFQFNEYPEDYKTIEEAKGNIMKVIITLD
jgi:threonine dehydrogenase-like Zn-dependent dehydrogenase